MRFLMAVLILVASSAMAQSVIRFVLTPRDVESAVVKFDEAGRANVSVQLTKTAAANFERLTCASVGKQLELIVDGSVVLNAKVVSCIPNGAIQITGNFTFEEAQTIARSLKPSATSSDSNSTSSSQNSSLTIWGWLLELLEKLFRR